MTEVTGPIESPLHAEWQQTTALYDTFQKVIDRQPGNGFTSKDRPGQREVCMIDTEPTRSHRLFPPSDKDVATLSDEDKQIIRKQPAFTIHTPILNSSRTFDVFAGIPQSLHPNSKLYEQVTTVLDEQSMMSSRILMVADPLIQRFLSMPLT